MCSRRHVVPNTAGVWELFFLKNIRVRQLDRRDMCEVTHAPSRSRITSRRPLRTPQDHLLTYLPQAIVISHAFLHLETIGFILCLFYIMVMFLPRLDKKKEGEERSKQLVYKIFPSYPPPTGIYLIHT